MTTAAAPPPGPPPPPPASESLLEEAVELTRRAGALTLDHFGASDLVVDAKGDGTPVTEADRGAERLVRDYLAERYPDDAVVGEEEGATTGTSGRRWVVDPIDGTKAFTRGVPLYSNLLALEDEHGWAVAVVNLPALGETVAAGRGLGCHHDGRRCHVSSTARLADAYLTTSGFEHWDAEVLAALHRSGAGMRTWGDGYGYALVATGRVDAMVDPAAALWDAAPMPLLLAEAGGRFTDFDGVERADGGTGVATNGRLHDEVLALVRTGG
ncbi:MAG: inositol monophosphatase family protein [Acidimicrobiia bacterium]